LSRFSEASSASPSTAASWRRSALICWFSTSICASGARHDTCISESQRLCRARAARPFRIGAAPASPLVEAHDAVALAFGGGEPGTHLRHLVLEVQLADLLQRQQLVELGDLGVRAVQRLVLAVTSCDRKNCTTTRNTDRRNTTASTSVDSASTKPGQ